ncbi:hypothetical protein [Algihabitans albus]|uniref:hypothetical protein n=1 Tax=Algihabitans albus TaxID=2164067 RepID=UPI000E5C81CC|nr:hypothetical protein [Algihabitans albus]
MVRVPITAKLTVLGAALLYLSLAMPAQAQLNNKPFSFNTPDGGVGMSTAGRQAMILDQVFGIRPNDLVRDSLGALGTVEQSQGGSVVFRDASGRIIPGFRGRSWRGPGDFAGSFNAFFAPGSGDGFSGYRYATSAAGTIGGWTSQLDPRGGGYIRVSGSPIDAWTSMVGMLAR